MTGISVTYCDTPKCHTLQHEENKGKETKVWGTNAKGALGLWKLAQELYCSIQSKSALLKWKSHRLGHVIQLYPCLQVKVDSRNFNPWANAFQMLFIWEFQSFWARAGLFPSLVFPPKDQWLSHSPCFWPSQGKSQRKREHRVLPDTTEAPQSEELIL